MESDGSREVASAKMRLKVEVISMETSSARDFLRSGAFRLPEEEIAGVSTSEASGGAE